MKTQIQFRPIRSRIQAFTLIEVLVATVLVAIVGATIYAGIACGFRWVQASRLNLRATQVMVEKMEVIRLLNWSQINSNGFIPENFSAPYTAGKSNLVYRGTIRISAVTNASSTYAPDLRAVTVTLNSPAGLPQQRWELTSYYGRYGLHNYIINK